MTTIRERWRTYQAQAQLIALGLGGIDLSTVVSDSDLEDAVALLQDKATAATDAELATSIGAVNTVLSSKADASTVTAALAAKANTSDLSAKANSIDIHNAPPGGASGTYLKKNSSSDYDFTWGTVAAAAVTVGSGANSAKTPNATASGADSFAAGTGTASGAKAFAEGVGTSATAAGAHAEGQNSEATGTAAHAQNQNTSAPANYSDAQGAYSATRVATARAIGGGIITGGALGELQAEEFVCGAISTSATPVVLSALVLAANPAASYSGAGANRLVVPLSTAMQVSIKAIARRSDVPGTVASFSIDLTLDRGSSGSVRIVGSQVTSSTGDAAASTWTLVATVDTGNNALVLTATGEAAKTISWGARVQTVEVA